MIFHAFVAVLATCGGCKGCSKGSRSRGTSTAASGSAVGKSVAAGGGDQGTFVHYQGKQEIGREKFVLARDGKGWKLSIDATDTLNHFVHEIWFDSSLHFAHGKIANTMNVTPPLTSAAVLERGSNGIVAERGKKVEDVAYERYSSAPVDWYIPELGLSAWFPACQLEEANATKAGHPRVTYTIDPATSWSVAGRELTRRTIHAKVLATTTVVIACDGDRLVGVGQYGVAAVREGDTAIAEELAKLPELQAAPQSDESVPPPPTPQTLSPPPLPGAPPPPPSQPSQPSQPSGLPGTPTPTP